MTSIERTAYPRFKRLITARELHLFFSPGREESEWVAERTDSNEHQLALLLMLKSYQRMGRTRSKRWRAWTRRPPPGTSPSCWAAAAGSRPRCWR
jgi:Domain of unknown function (DUF4158)